MYFGGVYLTNDAIHKATGLTVPGHSMTLPGTFPENLLTHVWGQWLEQSEVIPTTPRTLASGFVNSTITALFTKPAASRFTAVPLVCLV